MIIFSTGNYLFFLPLPGVVTIIATPARITHIAAIVSIVIPREEAPILRLPLSQDLHRQTYWLTMEL